MFTDLIKSLYLDYISRLNECGIRARVDPEIFIDKVLMPGIKKAEGSPGQSFLISIDNYFSLSIQLEGENLNTGIVPKGLQDASID